MEDKKIAIITGAGTGIGAATSRLLHDKGFYVGLHYNSSKKSIMKIQSELSRSFLIQGDLSTTEGCDQIYNTIKNEHNGQLDVLVNNAGIARDKPIFTSDFEDFETTVNLNMKSVWYLTKRLGRFMIRQKSGRIINISSVVAHIANPTQSIYSMTKAGVEGFTRIAARELAEYNILVNAIAPGFIDTKMTKNIPEGFKSELLKNIPMNRMENQKKLPKLCFFSLLRVIM